MNATLSCWTCRETAQIQVPSPPQFGFELAQWADDIGWRGIIDQGYGRALVFCSDECVGRAKTKRGQFKYRRPPQPTRAAGASKP